MVGAMRTKLLLYRALCLTILLFLSGCAPSDQVGETSETPEISQERSSPIQEPLGSILNFSAGDNIYFGGQPSADDLVLLQEKGVVTVVNLRGQDEMNTLDFDEREAVTQLGMGYIHLPLTKGVSISDEEINGILDVVGDTEKAPIILHCASSNRVGYVWAMYRALRENVETNEAIRQGEAAGLRSEALKVQARDFISRNRR